MIHVSVVDRVSVFRRMSTSFPPLQLADSARLDRTTIHMDLTLELPMMAIESTMLVQCQSRDRQTWLNVKGSGRLP